MKSPESFPSRGQEDSRLSEEAAHEEANMMRAKLEINPHTGKVPTTEFERVMKDTEYSKGGREPTAEDYDAALAALEELRELAAREPATEKVLNIFGRLSARSAMAAAVLTQLFIKDAWKMFKEDFLFQKQDWYPKKGDIPMEDKIDAYRAKFEDAAHKLRELKKNAKNYKKI